MNDLECLIREYRDTEIAPELESMVRMTIRRQEKRMKAAGLLRTSVACIVTAALVFIGVVNLSPASAKAMSEIPALRSLVRLVTFTGFSYEDETHKAEVKVPQIKGLGNSDLEKSLNSRYLAEAEELYRKFLKGIGKDSLGPEVLALFTNYKVKTDTADLLVVESIKTEIGASGAESVRYDNIDLNNRVILTLPSLFLDDSYIEVISANIKQQMQQKTNLEEGIMYFIKGVGASVEDGFDHIDAYQTFYITAEAKLVIVFDEYKVAPGSMGIVEFEIPTEIIKEILVSDAYVR